MDDKSKQASSFQIDQEILDARGIGMTVEEVAGLSTSRYSERVQAMRLRQEDLAFLKGLRRRIKNRLASQNSRRRGMEHLRRLARELRAVRQCKGDAAGERASLVRSRDQLLARCRALHQHLHKILEERADPAEVPSIELPAALQTATTTNQNESQAKKPAKEKKPPKAEPRPLPPEILDGKEQKELFKCRIDNLVQQSVNHIFKAENTSKRITAKTVFITDQSCFTQVDNHSIARPNLEGGFKDAFSEGGEGVLNLSLKQDGGRRSHGRKQPAPRRCAVAYSDYDDSVLDLKVKKENQ